MFFGWLHCARLSATERGVSSLDIAFRLPVKGWPRAVFFAIHACIAAVNALDPQAMTVNDQWIAAWNALSGIFFLAAVIYGNRAYCDMDPGRAFAVGREC
jgi:hypothetical protein